MNIQDLSKAVEQDLEAIEGLDQHTIMDMMKTIMQTVDKHAKELTRKDLWDYVHDLCLDEKVWDDFLVLRVCTLEEAIREAMVISACGGVMASYLARNRLGKQ